MKIISWNVNGLRAVLKKNFLDFVKTSKADIICLQETKTPGAPVETDLKDYLHFWNHAEKKGYSSTLILSKIKPLNVSCGLGIDKHDKEGRVIAAEYKDFILVNVYVPNSKQGLERLPYREKEWDVDFLTYLKKLEKKKPVIVCGDLNVAHMEIDLARPKENVNTHGFTPQERMGFDNLVKAGFVDAFRVFEKGGGHYTWWSPMSFARDRDIGWRIDYFCVSSALNNRLSSCRILKDVMGSDHCPVELILKD